MRNGKEETWRTGEQELCIIPRCSARHTFTLWPSDSSGSSARELIHFVSSFVLPLVAVEGHWRETMFGWWGEKKEEDPCAAAMSSYVRCVEGKADGLREGDECVEEAEAYKKCRQLVKEAKRRGEQPAPTAIVAATAADKQPQR